MIFDIIIIILLLLVIGGGVFLFQQLQKKVTTQIKNFQQEVKLHEEEINFIPYLARVPKESQLFDDNGYELEKTIQGNSFCTIVFEKDNMCKLLAGGWIRKEDIQQSFIRAEKSVLAKVKEDTIVRNGASQGYHQICRIFKGQVVEIKDDFGNWFKIITPDKNIGYVLKNTLEKY